MQYGFCPLFKITVGGEKNNGRSLVLRQAAQLRAQLKTVCVRYLDVQQDRIKATSARFLQCAGGIVHAGDLEIDLLEGAAYRLPGKLVVVNDHDPASDRVLPCEAVAVSEKKLQCVKSVGNGQQHGSSHEPRFRKKIPQQRLQR